MKAIRNTTLAVIAVILAVISTFSAFADSKTYRLRDLGMSVDIPDNMSVVTKYDEGSALGEDTYLEAKATDNSMSITVSMLQNEKTNEIYSFSELSYKAMEDFKSEMLSNKENLECTEGNYGGVKFLDFSQIYETASSDKIYSMQSVTLVNGKYIFITSQSAGDTFTSSELKLIKGCLESIRFDHIGSSDDGQKAVSAVVWVVVILLVLIAGFVALSFYMGTKSKNEKKRRRIEQKKHSDYDVLKNADEQSRRARRSGGLGGYKTSGDYFESDFDPSAGTLGSDKSKPISTQSSAAESSNTFVLGLKRIGSIISDAFSHAGYFFKNLSRELSHQKAKKGKGSKAPAKNRKNKRYKESKDYDVFRDK